jgi:enoyl-CoA hydratase
MTYETLLCTAPADHVLQITLNRPAAANAFNTKMALELESVFQAYANDPGDVRCVLLTGAGEKVFCAGADLKERDGMSNDAWLAQHRIFERFFWAMMEFPIPLMAAVNGPAFGGGFEMVLATDFAYAAPDARFALTETTLGIIPGGGGTQTLSRAVGPRRAKELIFSGAALSADDALAWGVINRICPKDQLLQACLATAVRIAGNGPLAVRQAKKAIHHGLQTDLTRGLWLEVESYNRLVFTEDRLEGVKAFNEKRRPQFKGK